VSNVDEIDSYVTLSDSEVSPKDFSRLAEIFGDSSLSAEWVVQNDNITLSLATPESGWTA
jgi:hypothetical protein